MAKVRILVRDLDQAIATYRDAFGFTLLDQHGHVFARMALDDLEIGLSGPESSAYRPLEDGTIPAPGGWNRILIETPDLEATAARFLAMGVTLRNDIMRGKGGAQILVNDGQGNVIEIFQTEPINTE